MAIYHFSVKLISRASGRSVIAAAAYRSASELLDERLGQRYDYTAKTGVVHSEILLPEGAPSDLLDRSTLWNTVERMEKRKDAQLAREVEFALPRELSQAEDIRLAQDFVREQFVSRGMVADLNVHWPADEDGEAKPHAHVMLTTRAVGAEGFGAKVRAWNRTELLMEWRERWATLANERLAELEHDLRIDHRSHAAQGIALEPQNKIGPAGARREARGEDAERAAEHLAIARRNGERIIAEPERVLDALTQQQSTFTRQDLARMLNRHTADGAQFAAALAKVEASPTLVRVGVDDRGQERLSTRTMLAVEQRLEAAVLDLAERSGHAMDAAGQAWALTGAARVLEGEQRAAFEHVTGGADVVAVVGYAGTGKSTMLGTARATWEAAGYRVRGAALSGIAAEGLEAGSGIASRTLASLDYGWARDRDPLSSRDVLVVDEAGMIGSRQLERVLSAARSARAKVVLVGDPEQLQAIEAGAAFRAVVDRVGAVELTTVRRQAEGWQQEATRALATGRTAVALAQYEAAGMVQAHDTLAAAQVGLVAGWDTTRRQSPRASQIMLTHRRVDVRALNEQARALRREAGELGADHALATGRGERMFAEGDRLYFLKNARALGVKNGTLGTVERIQGHGAGASLVVRLDGADGAGRGRAVAFALRDYAEIDHGYAATVHKAQGVTVDRAHVLATGGLDRHATYVALSRHRASVVLHWSRDEMRSRDGLDARLGRQRLKDTSLDYAPGRTQDDRGHLGPVASPAVSAAAHWKEAASAFGEVVWSFAKRRGLVPESAIILRERQAEHVLQQAASIRQAERQQAISAGRAGFRERYEAHQRQQAVARDEAARTLVHDWHRRIQDYNAALPQLEVDPALGGTRARLLQFGQALRDQPEAVKRLRADGAAFGVAATSNLTRVLAAAQPERVISGIVETAETGMRVQLKAQAELKARAEQEALRQRALAPRQGPSQGLGMSM